MKDKLTRRNFLQRLSGTPVVAPAAVALTTSGLWVPETKALSPGVYDFWIHGSSVQVEDPSVVKSITRLAIGSIIRQAEGTFNWFHFAIPTLTYFKDDITQGAGNVYLRARVDANTMIDKAHIYKEERRVDSREGLSIIGRPLQTPYAPELNPEEYCHGNVKQHLRNATPETVEELQQQVDRGFARLRRRPDLLLSFFHQAGLRVKKLC